MINTDYNPPLQWKKNETRWIDRDWNSEERAIFEDAIQQHGAELRLIREEVGTRSVYEVVKYYGHWKKCVTGFPDYQRLIFEPTARNSRKSTPRSGRSVPPIGGRRLHLRPWLMTTPKVLS